MTRIEDGPEGDLATTALAKDAKDYAVSRFRLKVVEGPDVGVVHVSAGTELTVGTIPGNELILTDSSISRHHCIIRSTPRGFQVRDLGSTNGTFLSGFRIDSAYLRPGATLDLGTTKLAFELLDEEVRVPLSPESRFGLTLGQSPAMRRVFAQLARFTPTDSTVLLLGETGTGKGLLAESIHEQSPRKGGPFVVVDCGAIPPSLLESELFGHEKGAFTGAHATRPGPFELAQGGTIFLDEIGELPLELQPRLLRVLDKRVIRRVGGNATLDVDVRVIAATNRDLRQEVNKGTFRADLFYRLNIGSVQVPPLRERREDIALLTAHFCEQLAVDGATPPELLARFWRRDWPGNVRELRNAVERALLLAEPGDAPVDEDILVGGELTVRVDPALAFRNAKELVVSQWERQYLGELVKQCGGNVSRAARTARMDRNHLRDLLRRHRLLNDKGGSSDDDGPLG